MVVEFADDGQLNVPVYLLPVTDGPVPMGVGAGDLQLESVLYPKLTAKPFCAELRLEPVTVINWLTGPVVGALVNEVVGAMTLKESLIRFPRLLPAIVAHT